MDDPDAMALLESPEERHYRARGPRGSERKREMPHRRIRLPERLSQGTDRLAAQQQTSWQEIVRQALEAYVPAELLDEGAQMIMS